MKIQSNSAAMTLNSFDLSFVREKLSNDGKLSDSEISQAEEEFRKFLALVLKYDGPLAMIDKRVDEFWHSFILFTPQYRQFCSEVMGFFVDHQPRTSTTPVPTSAIANFVAAYKAEYGELPSYWVETVDNVIRAAIESGNVPEDLAFQWSGWTGRGGI
ncbi:MAG: hypothetical protein JNL84_13795 [Candidatus Accumulibacter sp.]|nr:hypothetical protein [Accumulibacter sp.]